MTPAYQNLIDNPMFEYIDCPICGNPELNDYINVLYKNLKQKPSLDYTRIGISADTNLSVKHCNICGFVFANPRIRTEYETIVYNECKENMYSNFEELDAFEYKYVTHERHKLKYLPWLIRLIALADKRKNIRILDCGSGFGISLSLARAFGLDGYGIEIDRQRLSYCKELGLSVYTPEEFNSKYPELKFDLMIAQSIIEHTVDLNRFMSFLKERARKGTVLFVNGLKPDVIKIERKKNYFNKAHFIEHINYFPKRTFRILMKKYGFFPINKYIILINLKPVKLPLFIVDFLNNYLRLKNPLKGRFTEFFIYDG